jgi:hypothetical protein
MIGKKQLMSDFMLREDDEDLYGPSNNADASIFIVKRAGGDHAPSKKNELFSRPKNLEKNPVSNGKTFITTFSNIGMTSGIKVNEEPVNQGEGKVTIIKPVSIEILNGCLISVGPNNVRMRIGPSSTPPLEHYNKRVMIPAGTPYIIRDDSLGVAHQTEVEQEFVLEEHSLVTLSAQTLVHLDGTQTEMKFESSTVVKLE